MAVTAGTSTNAGVVDLQSRVDAMSMDRLQRMFAINVFGTFICALTIDHVGRRPYFAVSFAAAAVSKRS